jgi:hypothetical protein
MAAASAMIQPIVMVVVWLMMIMMATAHGGE